MLKLVFVQIFKQFSHFAGQIIFDIDKISLSLYLAPKEFPVILILPLAFVDYVKQLLSLYNYVESTNEHVQSINHFPTNWFE